MNICVKKSSELSIFTKETKTEADAGSMEFKTELDSLTGGFVYRLPKSSDLDRFAMSKPFSVASGLVEK